MFSACSEMFGLPSTSGTVDCSKSEDEEDDNGEEVDEEEVGDSDEDD